MRIWHILTALEASSGQHRCQIRSACRVSPREPESRRRPCARCVTCARHSVGPDSGAQLDERCREAARLAPGAATQQTLTILVSRSAEVSSGDLTGVARLAGGAPRSSSAR